MLNYLDNLGILQEEFIKAFVDNVGPATYRTRYPTVQQALEDLAMWCGFPL